MPTVSVVIPTHNRPEMLRRSIASIVAQAYTDWELIVVDDGLEQRADGVVAEFHNDRIRYIAHESERGGSAARNTGIRASGGELIAFLDDDDRWLPEKLAVQAPALMGTGSDVGFSFTAVKKETDDSAAANEVPEGIGDFHERALGYFSGFMTPTLLIKKDVFSDVGLFDEELPSHQETDLMIRITSKFKGLALNKALTIVSLQSHYEHVGSDLGRRIAGREKLLAKHAEEFAKHPKTLALHVFRLGLFYRDAGSFSDARHNFLRAFWLSWRPRHFLHFLSMAGNGLPYRLLKKRPSL